MGRAKYTLAYSATCFPLVSDHIFSHISAPWVNSRPVTIVDSLLTAETFTKYIQNDKEEEHQSLWPADGAEIVFVETHIAGLPLQIIAIC